MLRSPLRESFQLHEKTGSIASHLLVAFMMVCLAISIQHIAQRIFPGWQGAYIPWLAFLVSLEAMQSRREVRREADLITSRLVYRLIEWVVIALLVKLVLTLHGGMDELLAELTLWRDDFLSYFFDGEYVFALLVCFLIWVISGGYSGQLMNLEGDRFLLEMDAEMGLFSDRTAVRRQLAGRIFLIGMLMILLTTLVRWDYQSIWGDRPPAVYNLSYVMLYFLFGFALITLTHFAARRAVWALERTPLSRSLSRQWLLYSALFLLGVTLLAYFLPTGYSMGLLATLAFIINLLFTVVAFLFYLLSLPFIFFLNTFFNLTNIDEQLDSPAPRQFILPEVTPGSPVALPWWEALRSILFWGFFLAVTGYAFLIFFRQNQYLLERLHKIPGWRYLTALWNWLISGLARVNSHTRHALQGVRRKLGVPKSEGAFFSRRGFVNPRRLSPRQQVLFFYLMMLRRGHESGLPRRPSQTPFEYAERLENNLPEVDIALRSMTDEFVEARYSQHTITPDRARLVYTYWERIKQALRSRKKPPSGGSGQPG